MSAFGKISTLTLAAFGRCRSLTPTYGTAHVSKRLFSKDDLGMQKLLKTTGSADHSVLVSFMTGIGKVLAGEYADQRLLGGLTMAEQLKARFSFLGRAWCRAMHKSTMWPIHGEYECKTCLRRYPVKWAPEEAASRVKSRHTVPKKVSLA